MFQIALYNASLLFKAQNPHTKMPQLKFIKEAVRSWCAKNSAARMDVGEEEEEEGERQGARAMKMADPVSRLDGEMPKHMMVPIPPTPQKAKPYRKCRVCIRKGKRAETNMWCKGCQMPLHPGECFHSYHTKVNYK